MRVEIRYFDRNGNRIEYGFSAETEQEISLKCQQFRENGCQVINVCIKR